MSHSDFVTIALSAIGIIIIPTLVILVRGAIKWTRTEDQLGTLVSDVRELVDTKDKVHTAMLDQMRVDREATDRRLRFIEEWFMRAGNYEAPPPGEAAGRRVRR